MTGEVRALQLPEPQRFMTVREFAEYARISESSVRKLIRLGLPHEKWGLRIIRIPPAVALQWLRERDAKRQAA